MKVKLGYQDPLQQLAFLGLGCLLIQLMVVAVISQNQSNDGQLIWVISASCLLLFAFLNATMQLKAEHLGAYLSRSLYSFLGMLALTIALAAAFTVGREASFASVRVIYLVIILCYVIFLIIVFLMRKIMDYAQHQDQEHQP